MTELSEDPAERARNYIAKFEAALRKFNASASDLIVRAEHIKRVSDSIHEYLLDARYYLDQGKPSTSLAAVAYAEGLLDALIFLNLAEAGSLGQSI